jgi:hypothetical protein
MLSPFLAAGIKKKHLLGGQRIKSVSLRSLELIAPTAGEPQVLFDRLPADHERRQMLKLHRHSK